eukprot:3714071-Prymnesium_polylepis.1
MERNSSLARRAHAGRRPRRAAGGTERRAFRRSLAAAGSVWAAGAAMSAEKVPRASCRLPGLKLSERTGGRCTDRHRRRHDDEQVCVSLSLCRACHAAILR